MYYFLKKNCFVISIIFMITIPAFAATTLENKLATLESASGGRLGVSAIDTANHDRLSYRGDERFPMGCTSKVIGVSAVLLLGMIDQKFLQQHVTFTAADLAGWAPITSKHITDGMSVAELCAAAVEYSDNTAMNLLLNKMGGVAAVNAFARSIGDDGFRLDRNYPAEATSIPGDLRDTSTPNAMARSLQLVGLDDVLSPPLRQQLLTWMKNNTLGDARIRAGVPQGWVVADKTGTGSGYGATNDIAIIWPPQCPPIVVALFYTGNTKDAVKREDVLAAATRIVISEFAQTDKCMKL